MKIFIPIKKESQRVRNKNFRTFNGLPLYQYVITKLKNHFEIHVNTDSNEILDWCNRQDNVYGYVRKSSNIGNEIPVTDLIYDFIVDNNIIDERICQLHVTSPLLEVDTILNAIESGHDNIVGCDVIYNRFWEKVNGGMLPINHDPTELKQTQDLTPLYLENSSFYIFNSDEFIRTGKRIGDNPVFYEVTYPQNLDIDTEDDWDLVKKFEDKAVGFVDISCNEPVAMYPGSKEFIIGKTLDIDIDGVNSSYIQSDLHYGTHIDSPLHWIRDGKHISEFPSHLMNNKCQVIYVPNSNLTLDFIQTIDLKSNIVFLKFDNPSLYSEFNPKYYHIELDASEYLVRKGIEFIGTDYLSVEEFDGDGSVHRSFLGNGVWIIESLVLDSIEPGIYEYFCFPLILKAEASPVRVVIK